MIFLFVILIGGVALLSGGQIWALTGSMTAAWGIGLLVVLGLGFAARYGLQSRRNKRFWGEVDSVIRESEFTHRMPKKDTVQERIQQTVGEQSISAAKTVQALIRKGKEEG